jgi:dTDP-4-amino-4,6-dideoxygalactose transaminase
VKHVPVRPTVPFADVRAEHRPLLGELRRAADRVLSSGAFSGGAEVEAFEAELADHVGAAHAVGVASGTAALHLALAGAGITRGDEVILPPNTFFATAEAVVATGATPVMADVDAASGLLDPDAAEAAVGPRTAAIVGVHLYGQTFDADRLASVAQRRGLFLLEDAAQAFGASWAGRPAGSLGSAAAFSFYPTKNLAALGQAGAVTTDDAELASKVRSLRVHGQGADGAHELWGGNERLDELQAAFLRVKLRHVASAQARRDALAARYRRLLDGVDEVDLQAIDPRTRHVHHLMAIAVEGRDAVRAGLLDMGVETRVHYPTPIHLQPAWSALGLPSPRVRHAERHTARTLSLPLHRGLTGTDVEYCVEALADAVRRPGGAQAPRHVAEAASR